MQLRQTVGGDAIPAPPGALNIKREYLRETTPEQGNKWEVKTEPTGGRMAQGDRIRVKLTFTAPRDMAYVLRVTSEPVQHPSTLGKPKGGSRLARFSCWGPKAIAQIGHLPDTLRSRCILIRMQKKMAQEECERFEEDKPLLLRLRRQCLRFVRDNTEAIATARPELPKELGDRTVQI